MNYRVYTLQNNHGVRVEFISKGGRIVGIKIPYRNKLIDIVTGYDTPEESVAGDAYMGAICGRYANRINKGSLVLDGKHVQLNQNNGFNHLHGGINGFHVKNWEVSQTALDGFSQAFLLKLTSPDGDEKYPGNLTVQVVYALNEKNEFLIDFKAVTDTTTTVNLTSHPYFNLKGAGHHVLDHLLQINAGYFTPVDETMIPTGEIKPVENSGMDFRSPVRIGDKVFDHDPQIKLAGGLDHNWVINRKSKELVMAAKLTEPESGRSVEVFTTQPGLQVYTASHFNGSEKGKGGFPINQFSGIALEAQNFPDAPNHLNFPNAVLKKGEIYHERVMYRLNF